MLPLNLCLFSRNMSLVLFRLFLLCLIIGGKAYGDAPAAESVPPTEPVAKRPALPFAPGEQLTYNLSWSKVFTAGTATMTVTKETDDQGNKLLRFISVVRSVGLVDAFYRVDDNVQSLFDPRMLAPISYTMRQRHGKRKKERDLMFNRDQGKVVYHRNGSEEVADIPADAQDALSSLYYLRTQPAFTSGTPVVINVHDSGKNWAVEIHVLGKERISVPAGTFDTIKLKTYPKYDGVFMNKGEIFIWLTDDARRIPVLMKSTITIGSIVASLIEMSEGHDAP